MLHNTREPSRQQTQQTAVTFPATGHPKGHFFAEKEAGGSLTLFFPSALVKFELLAVALLLPEEMTEAAAGSGEDEKV